MLGNFVVDVCFKLSESMFAKHTHTFFILSALQFIQIWCVCVRAIECFLISLHRRCCPIYFQIPMICDFFPSIAFLPANFVHMSRAVLIL